MRAIDVQHISLWLWVQLAVARLDDLHLDNQEQQGWYSDGEIAVAKATLKSKLYNCKQFLRENRRDELLTEFFSQYPWADKVEDEPLDAINNPAFNKRLDDKLVAYARWQVEVQLSDIEHAKYEEYATE